MASGGGLVSVGSLSGSTFVAENEEVHDLFCGLGLEFGNPRHNYPLLRVVPQLQVAGTGQQEIPNSFVVDFDVGDDHSVLELIVSFDFLEDIADGQHTALRRDYLSP